jgi:hypothetical protein
MAISEAKAAYECGKSGDRRHRYRAGNGVDTSSDTERSLLTVWALGEIQEEDSEFEKLGEGRNLLPATVKVKNFL